MALGTILLTVIGLAAFEVISSVDNAVINAQVLSTMRNERARRFFTTWGIFFAIFVVRGVLPLLIIYVANPAVGVVGAFSAMFADNPAAREAIESSAPYLMTAGGMFLALLFLFWIFVEEKEFGLPHEALFMKIGHVWFYAAASIGLCAVLAAFRRRGGDAAGLMLAATVGFVAFFITNGFKEHAEAVEEKMTEGAGTDSASDWAKVLFLEVIDLTFSVDGVVGAFAFTTLVPLILVGNGIGAIVVRQLTLGNVARIQRYTYLKNGAMYSIGALAAVMVAEGFGAHVPAWVSPLATFSCIGFHLWLSIRKNAADARRKTAIRNLHEGLTREFVERFGTEKANAPYDVKGAAILTLNEAANVPANKETHG